MIKRGILFLRRMKSLLTYWRSKKRGHTAVPNAAIKETGGEKLRLTHMLKQFYVICEGGVVWKVQEPKIKTT